MTELTHASDLTTLHWLLAYGGFLVHVLLKLSEVKGSFTKNIKRKEIFIFIASTISIPIILIVCTDSMMKDILPINYVTAFLAGYQTQSFMKSIGKISNTQRTK
jgi:signal transduction histidine kinase